MARGARLSRRPRLKGEGGREGGRGERELGYTRQLLNEKRRGAGHTFADFEASQTSRCLVKGVEPANDTKGLERDLVCPSRDQTAGLKLERRGEVQEGGVRGGESLGAKRGDVDVRPVDVSGDVGRQHTDSPSPTSWRSFCIVFLFA